MWHPNGESTKCNNSRRRNKKERKLGKRIRIEISAIDNRMSAQTFKIILWKRNGVPNTLHLLQLPFGYPRSFLASYAVPLLPVALEAYLLLDQENPTAGSLWLLCHWSTPERTASVSLKGHKIIPLYLLGLGKMSPYVAPSAPSGFPQALSSRAFGKPLSILGST